MTESAADLYLDLLKKALTRALFEDSDRVLGFEDWHAKTWKLRAATAVARRLAPFGIEVSQRRPYDAHSRENGLDWPARAETMVGLKRLDNIQLAVESVLRDDVPGDLIETGVWRGGSAIFMRGVLKVHGDTTRKVWACDSFEGLPVPNAAQYPKDEGLDFYKSTGLAVGVEQVRHNFRRYGLLDDQVEFVVGWFKDTLPTVPVERLAVLRLDGDLYESTIEALEPLYPKLSPGGFCIIDDYHIPACRAAVDDYRAAHDITDEVLPIDEMSAYWRAA
ncbi:class I SAM-dependent methyltransferase [Nocardioides islandensis]|uniref:Class I SAM-dependent methyltransferase n=1 Tax=Nocardioides islandensis TaxID=433663 RepID=A0A930YGX5_9ACTN|nr:TylF/MycF/NovP-related O-methyltransferase [Nocardioides islandensis]MBF4762404.1 class I SAM-dependent methyltransferase [Nocardioides islandensis]